MILNTFKNKIVANAITLNTFRVVVKNAIKHYLHYITSNGEHYRTADGMWYKVKEE